jgi:hypothetical protein
MVGRQILYRSSIQRVEFIGKSDDTDLGLDCIQTWRVDNVLLLSTLDDCDGVGEPRTWRQTEIGTMCNLPWQDPFWDRLSNQKHRKSNKRTWDRSMTRAMTAERDETSQFDPYLTDQEIATMELDCIQGQGHLISDRCHKKTYYRKMDRTIGASAGESTPYIFVEYVNSGLVHGWPITWEQLRKKGVVGDEPD